MAGRHWHSGQFAAAHWQDTHWLGAEPARLEDDLALVGGGRLLHLRGRWCPVRPPHKPWEMTKPLDWCVNPWCEAHGACLKQRQRDDEDLLLLGLFD